MKNSKLRRIHYLMVTRLVLMVLLSAAVFAAADAQAEEMAPDLLFAGPLEPPEFDEDSLTPESGTTIDDPQPTIMIRIFIEGDVVVNDTVRLFVHECIEAANEGVFEQGDSGVRFNGDPNFTENASSILVSVDLMQTDCELPEGLITVSASARSDFGDSSASFFWTFEVDIPETPSPPSQPGPAPFRIDSLSPTSGSAGTTVMVTGAGFEQFGPLFGSGFPPQIVNYPGTQVLFAGRLLTTTVLSPNQLMFTVPESTGCLLPLAVQLFNESIPFETLRNVYEGTTNTETFSVIPCVLQLPDLPEFPTIDHLDPASGPPGTQVTVHGTGADGTGFFEDGNGNAVSVVVWDPSESNILLEIGGTELPTTYVGDHELRFDVPQDAECGRSYNVRVKGPWQTIFGIHSNTVSFDVVCEQAGIVFTNPQPAQDANVTDVLPELGVMVTTNAPGANIQPTTIEMSIDHCPGLVFKTISGGVFIQDVFSVDLAGLNNTPCVLQPGTATVTAFARDNLNNENTFSWSFNVVQAGNQPPTLSLTVNPDNPTPGDDVEILANASDPDGDPITYAWYLNDELQNANDEDGQINNINPGNYHIRVEVSDGNNPPVSDSVLISVPFNNGNHIPYVMLTVEPVSPPNPGAVYSGVFTVTASDADGDFLDPDDFEWYGNDLNDGLPEFRLTNQNNSFVSGDELTISFDDPGEYTIRVVVPDGQGAFGEDEVFLDLTGPSGSPSPSPTTPTIPAALDADDNGRLDDAEMKRAIDYWAKGETVPGAEEVISDCMIGQLTKLWISGTAINEFNALHCGAATPATAVTLQAASQLARTMQLRTIDPLRREVRVLGQATARVKVAVYDLNGRLLFASEQTGPVLRFWLLDRAGRPLANGTYLYVVSATRWDGSTWRSGVRKLVVLR